MKPAIDMSAEAIERRLREVAQTSDLSFLQPPRVSMAPADIEARLQECAEMSALCLELASFQPALER